MHDGARVSVGDDRTFGRAGAEQITEVGGLVVEAVAQDGMVEIDRCAGSGSDGGSRRVPPGLVYCGKAAGAGECSGAGRAEGKAGVELGEAVLMAGLEEGEGVDLGDSRLGLRDRWQGTHLSDDGTVAKMGHPGLWLAEGRLGEHLDFGGGAEPVDGEEGLVDADCHERTAGEVCAPGGVIGGGVDGGVAGEDEGDGTETGRGGGVEVVAEVAVEGEEGGLHGLHEEEVASASEGEEIIEFGERAGDGFLAENGEAGFEGGAGEGVMRVWKGGNVDGVEWRGEEIVEGGDGASAMRGGKLVGGLGTAGEDGAEDCAGNVSEVSGEAAGDGAGANDAPADRSAG